MAAFLDVCRFNPTAGGTTDWTFSWAVTGYQSPAAAGAANGRVYKYRAESSDLSQWEIGEGTFNTSTGVLTRTTVLYNSNGTGTATGQSGAGSKINFSAAPQIAIVGLKEDLISIEEANGFSAAQKLQARQNIGGGAAPNVQQTVDTTVRSVATSNTWTDSGVAVSITPLSTSSKVKVTIQGIGGAAAGQELALKIYRNIGGGGDTDITPGGVTELQGFVVYDASSTVSFSATLLDSPSTTSSITYKIYFKNNAGVTVYLGRRGSDTLIHSPTIITAEELAV